MEDGYGDFIMKSRGGINSMRNEEFQEEEVWGLVNERELDSNPNMMRRSKDSSAGSSSSSWRLPAAPRVIPRATTHHHEARRISQQSSAPVNIPDWSKIYRNNNNIANKGLRHGSTALDDHHEKEYGIGTNNADVAEEEDDEDDDDDDDVEMVPPHEYIAKRLARTQISSFSMCEGVGRTLKGRDLSKVRNAILTKTGFLE